MNAPEKDGEGYGNPLQRSPVCLENSMDRGTWWATVHGVAENQTQLSDYHSFHRKKIRVESLSLEYTRTVAGRGSG